MCVQKLEPTPTANLDRTKDAVYDSTTSVVRAVMGLSQGVQAHQAHLYLDLVKKVRENFIFTHSSTKPQKFARKKNSRRDYVIVADSFREYNSHDKIAK